MHIRNTLMLVASGAAMQMAAMKSDERAICFDEKKPEPTPEPNLVEPQEVWENDRNKTRLSTIATNGISPITKAAADKAWRAGGSPRAQIDAAREVNGKRLGYTAHQSDRERARTLAKLAKKQAKES